MPKNEVHAFLRFYPQIYLACHRRHVRNGRAGKILSLNQASILDHLDDVEPTNLRSLARHMGVTPSTMSLNVDRLVAASYVCRERAQSDARQVELRLTETGSRLKQKQNALEPELVRRLLKRLKREDRKKALEGLGLLASAAAELA